MKQRFSKRTRLVSALLTLAMVSPFCPSEPLRQGGDGGLYHHLNSIVSFLQKERYNIIVRVILSYCADLCLFPVEL